MDARNPDTPSQLHPPMLRSALTPLSFTLLTNHHLSRVAGPLFSVTFLYIIMNFSKVRCRGRCRNLFRAPCIASQPPIQPANQSSQPPTNQPHSDGHPPRSSLLSPLPSPARTPSCLPRGSGELAWPPSRCSVSENGWTVRIGLSRQARRVDSSHNDAHDL